ncbi:hypothetical protein DAKH74_051990 [Maudiozyma humilis]|uniref:Vacuolar membrane protein n=1 Tax=Maudiozyma humilis TaxID=51915 RepID=A0AAV5S7T1_MAUHU|nr:hypothetical protein DAKH74_051990 [Kazachstania humilis]
MPLYAYSTAHLSQDKVNNDFARNCSTSRAHQTMSIRLYDADTVDTPENLSSVSSVDGDFPQLERTSSGIIVWLTSRLKSIRYHIYEKRVFHLTWTHYTLLSIWFTLLIFNIAKYQQRYEESRLRASRYLNTILFGCSDILAQSISCYYSERIDPIPGAIGTNSLLQRFQNTIFNEEPDLETGYESDTYSVFNDYGVEPVPSREFTPERYDINDDDGIVKFNFTRFITFSMWGQFISFFQVPWYRILNFFFTEDPSAVQVFERVLADQLLYSPLFLFFFFTYSNYVMELGNSDTFKVKIQTLYISTLGCNLMVWPLAQLINFSMIPRQFQIPFSSSVGVLWNCFLSMRNASTSKSL